MGTLNEIADLTFLVNTENQILSYYVADKSILFASPEDFLYKKFTDVLPQQEAIVFANTTKTVIEQKRSVFITYDLPFPDGVRYFASEYEPCINKNGTVTEIVVLIKDITKQKEQERLLEETMGRYRSIFESASSGIVYSNVEMKVIECNQTYCDFLGISKEDLMTRDIGDFSHPEDGEKEMKLIQDLLSNQSDKYRFTKRYITANQQQKWGDLTVSIIRNEKNESVYFVGIVNDVTESIRIKEELKQANHAKDKLLSIISHDLRSPLSAIISLLYLAREDEALKDEYIQLIDGSAHQALELLENLLAWGNAQNSLVEANLQQENLKAIVLQSLGVVKNNADSKRITINIHQTEDFVVNIDRNMIYTVIRNILSNAIKFTHREGLIDCYIGKSNNEFWIEIVDKGLGMDADTLKDVFSINKKASKAGTMNEMGSGLGLQICNEFVQKHNGKIEVQSEPGQGSTFKVVIPI